MSMRENVSLRKTSRRNAKTNSPEVQRSMLCERLNFSASEAYKLLRTNLLFSLPDKDGCCVVGITSSVRGEGKTTTAINLSYTLAQTGKRVLLVDADMRLPSVSKKLKLPSKPGLSNCLVGMNTLDESILRAIVLDNLSIIPAGTLPPNPSELLGSDRMARVLDEMKKSFDFIIVDLPPVNIVSDALAISKLMDGMVMTVRQNYSDRILVNECVHHLEFLDTKLLGVVLTNAEEISKGYGNGKGYRRGYKYGYKYGYRYGYGYGYGRSSRDKTADRSNWNLAEPDKAETKASAEKTDEEAPVVIHPKQP